MSAVKFGMSAGHCMAMSTYCALCGSHALVPFQHLMLLICFILSCLLWDLIVTAAVLYVDFKAQFDCP